MGIMNGKTCIVTGGAGSIGLASAALLLSEGARVMLVGRNRENLARAAESLNAGDDVLGTVTADVSDCLGRTDATSTRPSPDGARSTCCSATPASPG